MTAYDRAMEQRRWDRVAGNPAPPCDRCGARRWCVWEVSKDEHGGPDLCCQCSGADDCEMCEEVERE